jgi:hypothetical protein
VSTVLSLGLAGVLFITVVLPAEFGVDPSGVGSKLGLKKMGEFRISLAEEANAGNTLGLKTAGTIRISPAELVEAVKQEEAKKVKAQIETEPKEEINNFSSVPKEVEIPILNHEMKITLAPDEGTEIKVVLEKGRTVQYTWKTNGGKANYDVHGDSKKLNIDYHNYNKGSSQKKEGVLEAAFDGSHGWFWRNRTSENMTITLITVGEYSSIKNYK